ncbi:MAG: ATP-binding cassette domain-containing protein [Clostridia bacterium]|nr:ATP-binding cassette domain-containing protein [Clostridia bacterium]
MIKIINLSKSYINSKNEKIKVLNNVSFEVNEGDRLGIIGNSGSGKTTLLKCISNLLDYEEGHVIYGRNINLKDKKHKAFCQKIGFVFQNYALFANKTVLQNVLYPLINIRKLKKETATEKAMEMLKSLKMDDKANAYPNQLSGGQKQRVAIARALVIDPLVLMFDEPTSALDVQSIKELVGIINSIKKDCTILIVTHSIEFASQVCNKIAYINNGKVEELKTVDKIFVNPQSGDLQNFIASQS